MIVVSYANAVRHRGDIYCFDGWRRIGELKASGGAGTWSRPRQDGERKILWAFDLASV